MPPIPAADFSGRQIPVNAGLWPPPPAACGVDRDLSPRTLAAKSSAAKFVPVLAPPPDRRGFRPPSTPDGFTASALADQVRALGNQSLSAYGPRQAAYDLKKLRGKQIVRRIGSTRRY